ncbi:MAG TPA: hypothetical protein VFX10_07830, partial [Nitrospira sp.]|nr:hypothetical protein [Nitrospira sp.]
MQDLINKQQQGARGMRMREHRGQCSFVLNGCPKAPVIALRDTLCEAAEHGFNWQDIYTRIYQEWYTDAPISYSRGHGGSDETRVKDLYRTSLLLHRLFPRLRHNFCFH